MQNTIVFYQSEKKNVTINVTYLNESFWLSQKMIAHLFGVDRTVITKHIKNIFETNELYEDSVSAIFAHTAEDGKKYNTKFYNLDVIIAVGYRVNSKEATQFRIWATQTLKEFIIKGFVLNDEMLKNGKPFGKDYLELSNTKIYF
ncbi:virulence RhuM family protein [Flavobacterium piscinae]|uniref:virulence RhuM family protein n=1 Tax=Flavobacterium piscinae TaxID=2506424 RepID=UPI0019A0DF13|nr:RhuM family protein [Flavobacterium piscinae]MBC8882685.1 virulence RhuM family protein [Flavobacterium piscinae]